MSQRPPIQALTGLRGVAACWVMLMHFREVTPTLVWHFPIGDAVIANGAYGVDVFFVLSGFVLSYAYESAFRDHMRWNDVRQFFIYRFARIYPVHFVTLAFMLALFAAHQITTGNDALPDRYGPATIISSLTLTHAWFPGVQTPNMPAWSVSAEWFAYLLFPPLCLFLSSRRWAIPLYAAVGLGLAVFHPLGGYDPARVLSGFLLGMAAYRLRPAQCRDGVICWAGPVLAVLIAAWASWREPPVAVGLVLFTALMWVLANDKDMLSRLLSLAPLVYLGEISYSLYMVHWPVRVVLRYGLQAMGLFGRIPLPLLVATYVLVAIVTAAASYRLVEIPGRTLLRRVAGSQRRSQVSTVLS